MSKKYHDCRSRTPRGLTTRQSAIPMRLTGDERNELEAVAAKENRSISSMARIIHNLGMQVFAKRKEV